MARRKINQEGQEFNPESIDWSKHSRKSIPHTHAEYITWSAADKTPEKWLEETTEMLRKSIDKGVALMKKRHNVDEVGVMCRSTYVVFTVNVLETEAAFKARVIHDEKYKWQMKKYQEVEVERNKAAEMKTLKTLAKKYKVKLILPEDKEVPNGNYISTGGVDAFTHSPVL